VPLQAARDWLRAVQQIVILAQQVNPSVRLPPAMAAFTYRCPRCQQVVVIDNEDLRLSE